MKLSDGLKVILSNYLDWSKPKEDCFSEMLLALLRLKKVNLTQLSLAFESSALIASRYRRLQRFFKETIFDYDAIAGLIMDLFGFYGIGIYLTIDRTNWKWGKKNLNILTLAVVYKGIAVPIYWLILNKQGNSNQRERIALIQRFIRHFGSKNILGILGDREFIGDIWWEWLTAKGIPYLVRVKENQQLTNHKNRHQALSLLFSTLKTGESRFLRKKRRIGGQWVWLCGLKLDSGELLILAGNQRIKKPLEIYSFRWEIENLFQCLKGRGFHLEETRITRYFRIKKIMGLCAIAFCWAHKTGEWKHKAIKPLKIKKHGRPEQSLFRYGLDYLTDKLLHGIEETAEILKLLLLFLCPPDMIEVDKSNANVV